MSESLAFQEALWANAKSAAKQGHFTQALRHLQPLLQSADDPIRQLLAYRLAGRVYAHQDQYKLARRMFKLAVKLDQKSHQTWYDLGQAFEQDPYGCDRRAAICFRNAVKLLPQEAKYRAAFGLALVRLNKLKKAFAQLHEATRLAGDDLSILKTIVTAYLEADRPELAEKVLAAVRFVAPQSRTLQELLSKVQYAQTAAGQRKAKPKLVNRVVPFLKIVSDEPSVAVSGEIIRHDFGSKAKPHFSTYRGKRG
jgi:tetratricopeptide (TPR) repeat protein